MHLHELALTLSVLQAIQTSVRTAHIEIGMSLPLPPAYQRYIPGTATLTWIYNSSSPPFNVLCSPGLFRTLISGALRPSGPD